MYGMRKPGRTGTIALALAGVLAVVLGIGVAFGADTITALPGHVYDQSTYSQAQGERPTFDNNEAATSHNVTARAIGPDGKPLFRSGTIVGINSTVVNGTQYLAAGDYPFLCTIHPTEMQGTLHVTSAGAAIARPQIDVSIVSRSLARVRNSGKALVKVHATTVSNGVSLVLKLGKAKLGSKSGLNLTAGQTMKVRISLTRKGRKKLAGRTTAKLRLVGSVPFGRTDTAVKRLR
jgi:plastocyanin